MDLNNTVLIIIMSCVMAFVIGTSIISIIDKKINNVSVNMPSITVPEPKVTIIMNNDGSYKQLKEHLYNVTTPTKPKEQKVMTPSPTPKMAKKPTKLTNEQKTNKFVKGIVQRERLGNILAMNDSHEIYDENAVPLYNDVEGWKEYAIAGCKDRRKKFKMYPNQVSCNFPNNLTAENYYNNTFAYPYIPGPSEELYFPSNYNEMDQCSKPDVSFKIVNKNAKRFTNKSPFPSNYWFKI